MVKDNINKEQYIESSQLITNYNIAIVNRRGMMFWRWTLRQRCELGGPIQNRELLISM